LALLLLGVAFMVAEAFAPSFGILGIGGAVAFAIGAIMMFEVEAPGFTLSLPLVGLMTAISIGFLVIALTLLIRSRRRRVVTGGEGLIGSIGRVADWSNGSGQIHVRGERWLARSDQPL